MKISGGFKKATKICMLLIKSDRLLAGLVAAACPAWLGAQEPRLLDNATTGAVPSYVLQRMFPTNNHTFLIIFNSLSHFFPKSVVTKIDPVLVKSGLF